MFTDIAADCCSTGLGNNKEKVAAENAKTIPST